MKKLNTVLFVLFTFLVFTSCSNEKETTTNESIIGKWELIQIGSSLESLETQDGGGCNLSYREFFENGTYRSGDYYINSQNDCTLESEYHTWSKEQNTLTILHSGTVVGESDYEEILTILELTQTTLIIKFYDEQSNDETILVFSKTSKN